MIFSAWNPDGGYDYYMSEQRHGIGDDLPDVPMPAPINDIGVPAQDVGRRIPYGTKLVGRGSTPKGLIAPMARGQVKGISGTSLGSVLEGGSLWGLAVAGGLVWIGYALGRRA
jgi:hypothetical protein